MSASAMQGGHNQIKRERGVIGLDMLLHKTRGQTCASSAKLSQHHSRLQIKSQLAVVSRADKLDPSLYQSLELTSSLLMALKTDRIDQRSRLMTS